MSNLKVGGALAGVALLLFALPMLKSQQGGREEAKLNDDTKALSRQASVRGSFLNSGSRDIGPSGRVG